VRCDNPTASVSTTMGSFYPPGIPTAMVGNVNININGNGNGDSKW